jgi:polyphenol oxidase
MTQPALHARKALTLTDVQGVDHGFFGRRGGVSSGIYGSLNCGLGSHDDRMLVLENRRRVAGALATPTTPLLTCNQIHSANAVIIDKPWEPDGQPRADAVVTRTKGLILGALAADCTPVLFVDPKSGVIAAAHAGWRGALDGIVEATLDAMEQIGALRADIRAAVGPCIGPDAYEVGPDFEAKFCAADQRSAAYFLTKLPGGRAHFDLPRFVGDRLTSAGCGSVEIAHVCTYAHTTDYFSFRRATHAGEQDYGRQISAIVLAEL